MPKLKRLKGRIKILAKRLKVFSTAQMCRELNAYPNNEGRRMVKSPNASIDRCATLLRMDSEIMKITQCNHGNSNITTWEWIGDEEE